MTSLRVLLGLLLIAHLPGCVRAQQPPAPTRVQAAAAPAAAGPTFVWVEGEQATRTNAVRHPWYGQAVKRELLSGNDFLSHWSDRGPGEAEYRVTLPAAGQWALWLRANPVQASLKLQVDTGPWQPVNLSAQQTETVNLAADGKPDLRFVTWCQPATLDLAAGPHLLRFRFDSANNNHGSIDCFVLTTRPFTPQGTLRPDQMAAAMAQLAAANQGWFPFAPEPDPFGPESAIDLRFLNEKLAGENGFITVRDGHFVHGKTGQPVRFWAVNGPRSDITDGATLRRLARQLAKLGVNLVRLHGAVANQDGSVDPAKVKHLTEVVEAMRQEGIYSHLSIYFPLWLTPKAGTPWLQGYDGTKHPFAALTFNPDFQQVYQSWWRAILTTASPATGRTLAQEPAVMGCEIVNEDSYFFWTFAPQNIPDPQLRILEKLFGDWLRQRYGSLEAAYQSWGGQREARDDLGAGRMAFRALWNIFNEKRPRDQDTARFLAEHQRGFYQAQSQYLRQLGFQGVICASNWTTASAEVFGPLEKWTYTVGDFIDRHGYFGCFHKGDNAAWSIREGHTYRDRSALRFEAEEPGKPRQFEHTVMDPKYDGKPSMVSEHAFTRPNRYRSEAPLYLASYAALQDSDAVVHFAFDSTGWQVKPNFWMQPWTVLTPATAGQFPAAALIYRRGLIRPGDLMVDLKLALPELFQLRGTILPQGAGLDELRLKDVPTTAQGMQQVGLIDPLVHYVGRTAVSFTAAPAASTIRDLGTWVDRQKMTVSSSSGELRLDYGRGRLLLNAPAAQGVCGTLATAGAVQTTDLTVQSSLTLGQIVVVALDAQPLASSRRMLLQVMSEEKGTDFRTTPVGDDGVQRITNVGRDPWLVRELAGTVKFKRADAATLTVTRLDANGYPAGPAGSAASIALDPRTVYYLITGP
ncbi:MAG: hypothetical protein IT204_18560 [Fimbriimonadaceae bacterium]|nr:hypothetical protein [Fimbriimonadaceae bacterium]